RPLPYRDVNHLVLVWTDDARRGLHREGTAYRTITDWASENHVFHELAFFTTQRVAPIANDPSAGRGRARSALVSANLFAVLGHLAPRVSVTNARNDLARIGRRLTTIYLADIPDFPGFGTTVMPVLDSIAGTGLQFALWLLLGATALVLLVACANVATLLLARGASRQQEFAVRRALGGGRSRLLRQLAAENVVLAFAGGLPALAVAVWGTRVLGAAAAAYVPRIDEISLDAHVLLFATAASIAAALLFGIVPALRLSAVD